MFYGGVYLEYLIAKLSKMSQLVFLNLGKGDWHQGFPSVTAQIGQNHLSNSLQITGKITGSLPPAPKLVELYQRWQFLNQALSQHLSRQRGNTTPGIEFELSEEAETTQVSRSEFRQLCEELEQEFNNWLSAEQFRPIERELRTKLTTSSEVRVIIETENEQLHRFPWHLWSFFQDYPQSELALSAQKSETVAKITHKSTDKVRILAIIGNYQGIEVQQDRDLLQQLPNAEIVFLEEPQRRELNDSLWDKKGWNILFFAGHSYTFEGGQEGVIELNQDENLTITELKNALRKAITNGLKLAIFNSCDGIGLAHQLQQLNIPQLIVMREPVPDFVAQKFLRHFLNAFSSGKSLYLAAREAREKLEGLESNFPCASWLPVIYQNPTEKTPDWYDLAGISRPEEIISFPENEAQKLKSAPRFPELTYPQVISVSLVVTCLVMAIRWLGFLQSAELQTYDDLMSLRKGEDIDSRIVVVEVTKKDTSKYAYPLKDAVVAKLLQQILSAKPRAVGLDMHRHFPRLEGREEFINLFNQHQNLFTVCAYDESNESDLNYAPPAEFPEHQLKSQVGFSNLPTESFPNQNRTVRRHLLSYSPEKSESALAHLCSTPYSLSWHLSYQFLHQEGVPVEVTKNQEWQFGDIIFPKLPSRFGGYQNLDGSTNQVMINYRSVRSNCSDSSECSAPPGRKLTMEEVLSGKFDHQLTDKIILVGYTAPVSGEDFNTPDGTKSGVWIHAHATSQILSAVLDGRPLIWAFSQWGDVLWVLGWSVMAGLFAKKIRSILVLFLASGIATIALHEICLGILNQGGWMPLIPSVFGLFLTGVILLIYRLAKSR